MKLTFPLLLVISVALWLVSPPIAQTKSESPSKTVLGLEKEWNNAYKRGDVATMSSLLSDDFIITTEDGKTYSKPGYIALNGNSTVHVQISDMSDIKVRMHGNSVAVVTGVYHEKGLSNGKAYEYHDRFTDVWMEINGKWQVIVSHYAIPAAE